jgi:hypothetical protein
MLTLDATASARIAAGVRGVAWLVDMDFSGGMVRYTTWPADVSSGGNTYTGLGVLVEIAALHESADTAAERLSVSLSVADPAMLALAMGDPATYRGRAAQLWLQLFDDTMQPAGAAKMRWRGYMDKLQISRTPAGERGDGNSSGRIEMICSRAGMARARNADGLRLADAQQQARYAGDTGLRYVRSLVEQPVPWLSKAFQAI